MTIHHFASYLLEDSGGDGRVKERQLKDLALGMRRAVTAQSCEAGDLFGSSADMWGFSVEMGNETISVGIYPPDDMAVGRWTSQVTLLDPGIFRSVRRKSFRAMKRVEWAVHKALLGESFKARDLLWDIQAGHRRRRKARPTP